MRADAARTDAAVFSAIVWYMRRRDRVCFASRASIAARAGCSAKTVDRSLRRLEQAGKIERADGIASGTKIRTCVWRASLGVRRIPKCPTTAFSRTTSTNSTFVHPSLRSGCTHSEFAKPSIERRERMASRAQLALVGDDDLPAAPDTAQTVLAAVVEQAASVGVPVSSRARGMLGKQVKQLLSDGYDPECLRIACIEAIRQNSPMRLERIASAIAVARVGQWQTQDEFRKRIEDMSELALAASRRGVFA